MPASPRIVTMGDTVWSVDASPGDLLVLNEDDIPMWNLVSVADHVDPAKATAKDVVNALIQCGLMRGPA